MLGITIADFLCYIGRRGKQAVFPKVYVGVPDDGRLYCIRRNRLCRRNTMGSAGYGAESYYKSIVTVSANHFNTTTRDHYYRVLPRYGKAAEGAVVADRRRLMHEKSKNNQTADGQSKSGLYGLINPTGAFNGGGYRNRARRGSSFYLHP